MFMRNFAKKGLLDAVGHLPDHWVRLNALGWHEKGVLLEEDLVEIDAAIDAKNGVADGEECVCVEGEG